MSEPRDREWVHLGGGLWATHYPGRHGRASQIYVARWPELIDPVTVTEGPEPTP